MKTAANRYERRDDLCTIFWVPMGTAVALIVVISSITVGLLKVAGAFAC